MRDYTSHVVRKGVKDYHRRTANEDCKELQERSTRTIRKKCEDGFKEERQGRTIKKS